MEESGIIKEERTHRRLDIRLKLETADELKRIAKRHDTTVTRIVKDLINHYISEHQAKESNKD